MHKMMSSVHGSRVLLIRVSKGSSNFGLLMFEERLVFYLHTLAVYPIDASCVNGI